MIELDIDLSYLSKHFNIGLAQIQQYAKTRSIKEIVRAEAEKGNKAAENFELEVLRDPKEIAKLFKLSNSANRYKILKNMNQTDLRYLLQFLEKSELNYALNFFTKTKLLDMLKEVPKEEILNVVFEAFSVKEYLELIPEKEMDKFFKSEKVDKKQIKEMLKSFPPEALAKMLETVTGQVQSNKSHPEMWDEISQFSDAQLQDGLESLTKKHKMLMVEKLTQKDPDLWKEFSSDTLVKPMEQLEKAEIIKSMEQLEPDTLLELVSELPQDFMAIVVTQIDPMDFADQLVKYFGEVLGQVVMAQ